MNSGSAALGIQAVSLVVGMLAAAGALLAQRSASSQVTFRRGLQVRALSLVATVGFGILFGNLAVYGPAFFHTTSIANLVILVLACLGVAAWGVTFLVVSAYLQPLVGDLASGVGLPSVPTPVAALVTLSPLVAGAAVVFLVLVFVGGSRGRYIQAVREIWGVKYIFLLLIVGIALTWTYYTPTIHLYVLLDTYWLVILLPALVLTGVHRAARITRALILLSFWLRVGIFAYQILSRPLLFTPQISSLTSLDTDNTFRLGGLVYGANNSALTLLVLIPFGLAWLWQFERMAWSRPLLLLALAYIMYRTDTRAAWLGLVVVLGVYFTLLKSWLYLLASLVASAFAVTLLPYVQAHLIGNVANSGGASSLSNNLGVRPAMWGYAIEHALTDWGSWVFGSGWAGPNQPWTFAAGVGNWSTLHNLWVAVLVRSGLVGLTCWIAFYVESTAGVLRAYLGAVGPQRRWYAAGVASLVGFLFFSSWANADWPQATQMVMLISVNLWCSRSATQRTSSDARFPTAELQGRS